MFTPSFNFDDCDEPAYAYVWEEQDEAIEEIQDDIFSHPSLTPEERNATLHRNV